MSLAANPPFTAEYLRSLISYDCETGIFCWRVARSTCIKVGRIIKTPHGSGYLVGRIDGRLYLLHRLAWFYVYGSWPANQIDHINGIRSDNRLVNLRLASNQQNSWNGQSRITNKRGYKGVKPSRISGAWDARITVNGKEIYLGYFKRKENAALAYNFAALEHFGSFARYNKA